MILTCHLVAVVSRVSSALVPNYVTFVVSRIISIAACFGFYTAGFILGMLVTDVCVCVSEG